MKTYMNTGVPHPQIPLLDWAAAIIIAILGFGLLRPYFANGLMNLYRCFFQSATLK
jgi:hypothetical protein